MFKLVNKLKNRKGFTLIELVVVIAILGILALIAIPRFAGVRDDADDQAMATTAVTIVNAAELYAIQEDYDGALDTSDLIGDGLLRGPDEQYNDFGLSPNGDGTYNVTYTDSGGTSQTVGD